MKDSESVKNKIVLTEEEHDWIVSNGDITRDVKYGKYADVIYIVTEIEKKFTIRYAIENIGDYSSIHASFVEYTPADISDGMRFKMYGNTFVIKRCEQTEDERYAIADCRNNEDIGVIGKDLTWGEIRQVIKIWAIEHSCIENVRKHITMHGSSLVIAITDEARLLGLNRGDEIVVSLKRTETDEWNRTKLWTEVHEI